MTYFFINNNKFSHLTDYKNITMIKKRFKNNFSLSLLMIAATTISSMSIATAAVELTSFDWQVACDNTRTCRLAGYQAENNSDQPVSVLLTRRAGANAEVAGKVKLGGAKESSAKALMQLGNRHRISLFINDKDLGETQAFSSVTNDANLTQAQVSALLDALTTSSKIELVFRNSRWQLSDKGSTAVMLKADEAQGRIGTPSAFISSSDDSKSNNSVLPAKPIPQLKLVLPVNKSNGSKKFSMRASQLTSLIEGSLKNASSDCPNINDQSAWQVTRLNNTQLLAQHSCWTESYNTGTGVWVLNDSKPYTPTLITTRATDYSDGKISSIQKGRSAGDCVSKSEWVWVGSRFMKSHESTTGLCRMIEAGGAWQLPTYVSVVKVMR